MAGCFDILTCFYFARAWSLCFLRGLLSELEIHFLIIEETAMMGGDLVAGFGCSVRVGHKTSIPQRHAYFVVCLGFLVESDR